jgi:glycosyltransferase involved in cell wall biosynthesis
MLVDACREPADVIAATAFPLLHMHLAVIAARARRIPVVLFGALHPEDRWGFDRGVIRYSIRHADAYCAYTDYEREYVVRLGVAGESVHVLPLGVEPALFASTDSRSVRAELGIPARVPVIGFLGQLGGHKGIEDLIAAMRSIWSTRPDAWLVIAGASTPDLNGIKSALERLSAEDRGRTRLLVDVDEARKPSVLAAFDIFASPSGYESFGLTFLEAWAAGVPVIGCRAGAVPSLVREDRDGLLIDYRDGAALAAALRRLLDDPDLRRRLAQAGRANVHDRFTWARTASRVDHLYRRLVDRRLR